MDHKELEKWLGKKKADEEGSSSSTTHEAKEKKNKFSITQLFRKDSASKSSNSVPNSIETEEASPFVSNRNPVGGNCVPTFVPAARRKETTTTTKTKMTYSNGAFVTTVVEVHKQPEASSSTPGTSTDPKYKRSN